MGKDSNIRVLNVDDENMDTVYFVSAQWEEMPGTNKHMSTLFANWLNASVSVDMAILFQGKLLDLISQPSQDGRIIKTGKSAGSLLITLTLPENNRKLGSGYISPNIIYGKPENSVGGQNYKLEPFHKTGSSFSPIIRAKKHKIN